MIDKILKAIFGSRNERLLKKYRAKVAKVNALEPQMQALDNAALAAKTEEFKARLAKGETLDDLLPEAFAVVREGAVRALGMRHFDVQLIGGMVLHDGKIAEMRTGEGKTLMATLAAYLNALTGQGVHIITVNDYLAQRDAEWMGRLYNFLGLTVGVNLTQMEHTEKQKAYAADITYGTNNEFGFDYLRDNMVYDVRNRVQRKLIFAIVDEVDSILIDEARTPLIISGPAEETNDIYVRMNAVPPLLKKETDESDPGDFTVDEKAHQILLTEQGHEHAEEILERLGMLPQGSSLYDAANISLMHHLNAALRAHNLFFRDQHYVVQNGKVVIIDEFTGRLMEGRRWSEGLHQAIEAKEGVEVEKENQTLASITFQNYFRMYQKLAGMTGTADTEAYEFQTIYNLETVVIPTHRPMIRTDRMDQIYCSTQEKYNAVVKDIRDCYERGQPVLVGTTTIENSEALSKRLTREGLPHQVLNAKQHEREALIVAQAGRPKMITIATNMAGRGTDIVLGGNVEKQIEQIKNDDGLSDEQKATKCAELEEMWQTQHQQVLEAGGLHIIGTERHESRRVDNQLRGRSGRQGDPGSSRFYLSLDDPLMRIFAGDRIKNLMRRMKMPEGEAIEHSMVTRTIESAQRKVEARNFDIRKQLLEYDDVANDQRKIIYQQRNEILESADVSDIIANLRTGVVNDVFNLYLPEDTIPEQWDLGAVEDTFVSEWQVRIPVKSWYEADDSLDRDALLEKTLETVSEYYKSREEAIGEQTFRILEKSLLLQIMDMQWREHLSSLDQLRQGIHLRGYAQVNPKQEYKRDAFRLLETMLERVKRQVVKMLMTIRFESDETEEEEELPVLEPKMPQKMEYQHASFSSTNDEEEQDEGEEASKQQPYTAPQKVGRNEPCPCGSGKKYKHCHGKPN